MPQSLLLIGSCHGLAAKRTRTEAREEPDDAGPGEPVIRRKLPGLSLADAAGQHDPFREDPHMQDTVMKVVSAVAAAVGSPHHAVDTHDAKRELKLPTGRPDCTLLAEMGTATWSGAVSFIEAKLSGDTRQVYEVWGQQIERARNTFKAQPSRDTLVAVNVFMNFLEVLVIRKQPDGGMRTWHTSLQPFSLAADSPGFQLLVRLLGTTPAQLGYKSQMLPAITALQSTFGAEYELSGCQLLRTAEVHRGRSCVLYATATKDGVNIPAVVKLCLDKDEV